MATTSTCYKCMGMFHYHTTDSTMKMVNVMDDLLSVVQDMMKGEAVVTSQTLTDDRSTWNIRGPRKHLLVTLHYDQEQSNGENNNVEVNYSRSNNASFTNSSTDNPENFGSTRTCPSSANDNGDVKCIEIRTGHQTYICVDHHQSTLPGQLRSDFSATREEELETAHTENLSTDKNLESSRMHSASSPSMIFDDDDERILPHPIGDSAKTIEDTKSWAHTFTGSSIPSEKWNLLTNIKCEPLEVDTETPATNCHMAMHNLNKLELQHYGNQSSEELENAPDTHENSQSDKEMRESAQQTVKLEVLETHQIEGSFITRELEEQVTCNPDVHDESSSSSSYPKTFPAAFINKPLQEGSADKDIITCTHCEAISSATDLATHECSRETKKLHTCRYCNEKFKFISILKLHEKSHYRPFSYYRLNWRSGTLDTTRFVIPDENSEVVQGSSETSTEIANSERTEAKQDAEDNRMFQCSRCDKQCNSETSLIWHMKKKHNVKAPQCFYCRRMFKYLSHLIYHERTHTGIKPYECAHCEKTFVDKSSMVTHERTHTGEKPYQCSYCKKAFNTSGHLKLHERTHTGERPYQCSHCQKAFVEKSGLRIHERTHTGEKPYQCSYCKKAFSTSGHLKKHERTHTGEKPHQCSYCKKMFVEKGSMIRHERTHTGEKPYHCTYCKKAFNTSGHLKKHARTHTGEKPYQCSYCTKMFVEKGHLINHERTHTGEKPYQCSYCKKGFIGKGDLTVHERTHTGEKPYQCSYCKEAFVSNSNLKKHERKHT